MVKRFTDTEKFKDRWYRNLTPKQKCIWEYMLSACDIAGFFEIDYEDFEVVGYESHPYIKAPIAV